MFIPKLSANERSEALKKAKLVRAQRVEVRNQLKNGEVAFGDLLDKADDEIVGGMRVKYALESLPKVGKVTAAKIMQEVGIDETRRIRGLGSRQKVDLLKRLTK